MRQIFKYDLPRLMPWAAIVLFFTLYTVASGQAPLPKAPPPATPPKTDCVLTSKSGSGVFVSLKDAMGQIAFWTDFTVTCSFVGRMQYFTTPSGTDHSALTVDAYGAAGGDSERRELAFANDGITLAPKPKGGLGARVLSQLSVEANTTYQVFVGGAGRYDEARFNGAGKTGGFNGGGNGSRGRLYWSCGGGGATDLRRAPNGIENRLVIAGGGGGSGGTNEAHGGMGGLNGSDGKAEMSGFLYLVPNRAGEPRPNPHGGGFGATQTAPGAGGETYKERLTSWQAPGMPGIGPLGGTGDTPCGWQYECTGGGGGGGGLFGGGSGSQFESGGGGGGSSRGTGDSTKIEDGVRAGDGQMILSYRVYTKRVPCQNISPKAVVRGSLDLPCSSYKP